MANHEIQTMLHRDLDATWLDLPNTRDPGDVLLWIAINETELIALHSRFFGGNLFEDFCNLFGNHDAI